MQNPRNTLEELLSLSRQLGASEQGWAILGEGNTSARIDDDTFLVKASGSQLGHLREDQLVAVRFAPLLAALDGGDTPDDQTTRRLLAEACVQTGAKTPSVETLFHANLLSIPGVAFIGHTHVTSINGLLCSENGWNLMQRGGRLFPDEIVVCGVAPCCVPYTDPGLPLARAIRDAVRKHIEVYGAYPKTIYLQSHGFIALGATSQEVLSITMMADKAAKIMLGAIAAGGPRFMPDSDIARIATRPDEHVRQRELGLKAG
jgi:rhamnose utilization protein RhaD (predicted bifunctional aldolase and dehydrogenase)